MGDPLNNRLAKRLLVWVLVCSALLSALATTVQLYANFQRQEAALFDVKVQIEKGFAQSLSSALWSYDTEQVDLLLDGIFAEADISSLKLSSDDLVWERGPVDPDEQLQMQEVQLSYTDPVLGETVLGQLELGLSRARIWSNLYALVLVVFLSNLAKTGFAAIAILVIFQRIVSRHLRDIASYVSQPKWLTEGPELKLDRQNISGEDDLDAIS
ncbi:hypothetical protein ACOTTU_05705 [Roseobacter sp. EG26]|uniref:hypothetical protein n=1 Tax=Roseobacter sp. EG26 TaxID=3412477 RepID=UPI003CE5A693